MPTIVRNGIKLVFEDRSAGKPAFVFVHGTSCNRSFFAPQAEHFARRHRVVSIDLRGHGESDKPCRAPKTRGSSPPGPARISSHPSLPPIAAHRRRAHGGALSRPRTYAIHEGSLNGMRRGYAQWRGVSCTAAEVVLAVIPTTSCCHGWYMLAYCARPMRTPASARSTFVRRGRSRVCLRC